MRNDKTESLIQLLKSSKNPYPIAHGKFSENRNVLHAPLATHPI